jgi:DegV family protein with EDD domain
MQLVSDRGSDLSSEQMEGLDIHFAPLTITLDGKSYKSGVDIQHAEFYELLASTESFPTTSQPSAGDFAELYRKVAADDPDILSVHMSSGLSGTYNSACQGAKMVPEANVTVFDTKTLAGAAGFQVEAAARAIKAGWEKSDILAMLERIRTATEAKFTLSELKYLIHGGRISHMKGLIASMLNIKPIIGVEKVGGTYEQLGQARTFRRAVEYLVDTMTKQYAPGTALRVMVTHAANPDGVKMLRERIDSFFECDWLPTIPMAPVLGAHTGPSMVGCGYAPLDAFAGLPWFKSKLRKPALAAAEA